MTNSNWSWDQFEVALRKASMTRTQTTEPANVIDLTAKAWHPPALQAVYYLKTNNDAHCRVSLSARRTPAPLRPEAPPGIPARIRQAREARGLTWYALAKLAGIPNANTVRAIENGRDAQLSTLQAVAQALGLRLELIEEKV